MVSFKLETDADLLLEKAVGSIEKYGSNAVVANMLQTYKQKVSLVLSENAVFDLEVDEEASGDAVLESQIVERILGLAKEHFAG